MKRWWTLLAALSTLLSFASACARQDVIVMVGESTTYGQTEASTQSPVNAAVVLEFLLSRIDYACPYAKLPVRNWAVPGSNTVDWFVKEPKVYCVLHLLDRPLVKYACAHHVPLAQAVLPVAKARDEDIKIVLVNAQGTNDAHIVKTFTPEITVDNIATWPLVVAPAPVLISPPFFRSDTADSVVVRTTRELPEKLAAYVKRVRELELSRGLVTGPDWGILFANPPFQSDGFHLTDGGSAVAAAYWLDKLCPRPIPPPLDLPPMPGAGMGGEKAKG